MKLLFTIQDYCIDRVVIYWKSPDYSEHQCEKDTRNCGCSEGSCWGESLQVYSDGLHSNTTSLVTQGT